MDEIKPKPGSPLSKGIVKPRAQGDIKKQILAVLAEVKIGGCVTVTSHFKMRAAQRGFTTPEALTVLKRGRIIRSPEFCAEFCNWKFSVEGDHDDGNLIVIAAIS